MYGRYVQCDKPLDFPQSSLVYDTPSIWYTRTCITSLSLLPQSNSHKCNAVTWLASLILPIGCCDCILFHAEKWNGKFDIKYAKARRISEICLHLKVNSTNSQLSVANLPFAFFCVNWFGTQTAWYFVVVFSSIWNGSNFYSNFVSYNFSALYKADWSEPINMT